MEIVVLQIFVSLALVAGSLILFALSTKQRDYEHADRLALLPIQDDDSRPAHTGAVEPETTDTQRGPVNE